MAQKNNRANLHAQKLARIAKADANLKKQRNKGAGKGARGKGGKRTGVDWSQLRKDLRPFVNVPKGRLTPQKKGALTRAAAHVAYHAKGGTAVTVRSKGRADALAELTGQSKRDKVFFVAPLPGEKLDFTYRKVDGKRRPVARFVADSAPGYWRVFLPFDQSAFAVDPVAETLRVASTARGNAVMGAAGRYVVGQRSGNPESGRQFLYDEVAALARFYQIGSGALEPGGGSADSPNLDAGDWAKGLYDVYDPNLPDPPGIGSRIAKTGDLSIDEFDGEDF